MKKTLLLALTLLLFITTAFCLASCDQIVFNVNYMVDGEVYHTEQTDGYTTVTLPKEPTKEGYTFGGWYYDQEFTTEFTSASSLQIPIFKDMNVYAKWNAKTLEGVTFPDVTVTYDGTEKSIGVVGAPEGSTVTYTGVTAATNAGVYTAEATVTCSGYEPLVLTAKLTINKATYDMSGISFGSITVSFDNSEHSVEITGDLPEGVTVEYQGNGVSEVGVHEVIASFTADSVNHEDIAPLTATITITAPSSAEEHTVSFDSNGGSEVSSETVANGGYATAPTAPTRTGYTFAGWFVGEDEWSFTEDKVTSDVTLVAKWTAVEYTATFVADGATVGEVKFTVQSSSITAPAVPLKNGYTGEWESYTLGTSDITVNAVYTAIEYTATFVADGATVGEVKFTVQSSSITAPAVPQKNGYTGEWESYTLGTSDITVNAIYTANTYEYDVIYVNGTGKVLGTDKISASFGSTITVTPEAFEGYTAPEAVSVTFDSTNRKTITFTYTANGIVYNVVYLSESGKLLGEATVVGTLDSTVSANPKAFPGYVTPDAQNVLFDTVEEKTVTFTYEIIEYTATFKADGDTVEAVKFTVETESITAPAVPQKTGYTGTWQTYSLGADNVTVNALYTPITYTVTFVADGNTVGTDTFTVEDKEITVPEVTFKNGYTGKWESYTLGTADVTVNANYTPVTYTITYNTGAHTSPSENLTAYTIESERIVLKDAIPSNPVAYTFVRWYVIKNDVKVTVTEIPTGSTGNLALYAEFALVDFTVTLNANGGELSFTADGYNYETPDITLPTPEKNGYIFGGWYANAEFSGAPVTKIARGSTGNKTFYAKWTAESCTAIVNHVSSTGKLLATTTVSGDFGTTVAVTPESFPGYSSPSATTVTIDTTTTKTVTLTYTLIEYTVTFKADGATVNSDTFTLEDKNVTAPAVPEKAGYTGKWADYALGASDATVNAIYTPITYTVTFIADGKTVGTDTFNVENKAVTEPEIPQKTGYTSKWASYTLGASDATVNAVYTPITYTVTFVADGKTVGTDTFNVENKTVTEPAVPAKAGYTGKWASYTLGASDATVNAVYTPITYTATFVADGKTVGSVNYTVETAAITAPAVPEKAGYTAKWETYTLGAQNVTVNAIYTPITYTVTFVADGNTVGTDTFTVEDKAITEPAVPAKAGYTGKWETYTLGASDATVNAVYSVVTYTITFSGADGVNAITYTVLDTMQLPSPTKSGFAFGGWYESSDLSGTKLTSISAGTTGNKTLYARWCEIYSLNYVIGDGATLPDTYPTGASSLDTVIMLSKFGNPTRPGYTFLGWYTNPDFSGTKISVITPSKLKDDYTLYAKWQVTNYTITYELNGGTNNPSNPTSYDVNSPVTLLEATRDGYILEGWYTDAAFTAKVTELRAEVNGSVTLYAKWLAGYRYNLTFVVGEGATLPNTYPTSVTTKDSMMMLSKLGNPTRPGYTFSGWYTTPDFSGTKISVITPSKLKDDYTLYAKWEVETFAITYVLDGGVNNPSNPDKYPAGTSFTFLEATRDGYIFMGWYDNSDHTGDPITEIKPTDCEPMTLYAKWVEGYKYNLTFVVGDGATLPDTYPSTITSKDSMLMLSRLGNPTRPGYTFVGWYTSPDYIGTKISIITPSKLKGDYTLYAKWTATFNVNYVLNGGTNSANNPATYDMWSSEIALEPAVRTDGYTFAGWYADAALTKRVYSIPANSEGDMTFYAKWVEGYAIIYVLNGGANNPDNPEAYKKGETNKTIKDPKYNYAFAGWYLDESLTTPFTGLDYDNPKSVTLYAKWDTTRKIVYYSDFGHTNNEVVGNLTGYKAVVGDGVTDDFAAIDNAHEWANQNGIYMVIADHGTVGNTFYFGKTSIGNSVVIRTNVDFGATTEAGNALDGVDKTFTGATFIIDDSIVLLNNRGKDMFKIMPNENGNVAGCPYWEYSAGSTYTNFSLTEGQANIGRTVSQLSGGKWSCDAMLYIYSSSDPNIFTRWGSNSNSGAKRSEVILVSADGTVDASTPIMWNYSTVDTVRIYPLTSEQITIKNGNFITIANHILTDEERATIGGSWKTNDQYYYYERGFGVYRCNAVIDNINHAMRDEVVIASGAKRNGGYPYTAFYNVQHCNNVIFQNCEMTGHTTYIEDRDLDADGIIESNEIDSGTDMGSYDISGSYANNVKWINCSQPTEQMTSTYWWGIMGTNYLKNLTYDSCYLSRFDAHAGVWNATIKDTKIGLFINLVGGGTAQIERTHVMSGYSFLTLREDYGSTWKGDINIIDCEYSPYRNGSYGQIYGYAIGYTKTDNQTGNTITLISGQPHPEWNFGYRCHLPYNVTVKNFKITGTIETWTDKTWLGTTKTHYNYPKIRVFGFSKFTTSAWESTKSTSGQLPMYLTGKVTWTGYSDKSTNKYTIQDTISGAGNLNSFYSKSGYTWTLKDSTNNTKWN